MDNLREETLRVLREHDKTIEDIRFICSCDINIPIDMFFIKADNILIFFVRIIQPDSVCYHE